MPAVDKYYGFWTREPHLVPRTGLSRYYDLGEGPAPEVVHGERDANGLTHYDRVRAFYRTHDIPDYDKSRYYDKDRDALTPLFYVADRTMRESGFDPSNRFGPFGAAIIDYVPVCLNVLLYRMEQDAAQIAGILGNGARATEWRRRADVRAARIDALLWDGDAGMYFDYNFATGRRRAYPFATTFYPLWAGLASRAKAARVHDNLARFEAAGGVLTSTSTTGNQWDAPFGWAPLQIMAVEGLRRYGYREDADRLARKFISLVAKDFAEHGVIVEKYDLVRARSDIAADVKFGYTTNVVGFGWTNAAVLTLLGGMGRGYNPPQ
jgi:alpha,alpha-trehalase